jgi:hypothetical protein
VCLFPFTKKQIGELNSDFSSYGEDVIVLFRVPELVPVDAEVM